MALQRGIEDGPEQTGRARVGEEERRIARTSLLARGTLACPSCDAPVAPVEPAMAPPDSLACPYCAHAGAVRDFLSLGAPTRPARVDVRVVGLW